MKYVRATDCFCIFLKVKLYLSILQKFLKSERDENKNKNIVARILQKKEGSELEFHFIWRNIKI